MKTLLLSILSFALVANTNAQETLNKNINWSDVSTSPTIDSQDIMLDSNIDSSILNEIMSDEYSFLTKETDDRVFYNYDAEIRVLNKQIDKIFDFSLQPDNSINIKNYDISIKSCASTVINNTENQMAFVQIYKAELPVFRGWMSNVHKNLKFPELPELNISLLSCTKTD